MHKPEHITLPMSRHVLHMMPLILSLMIAATFSCSTTRIIPEGSSRLKNNKVTVVNDKKYPTSDIYPYIKQKPNSYYIFGWNPFLNIYNWSAGSGSGWDRFVRKLGVEPVIYDSTLVASSIRNITDHLTYQGYYNSIVRDSVTTKNKKTTVNYEVELGDRYILENVEFHIDDMAIDSIVRRNLSHSHAAEGRYLSENMLEKESERLTSIIRENGYFTFNKNFFHFEADTSSGNGTADLHIYIRDYTRNETSEDSRPHSRFRIDNVNIITVPNLSEFGIYGNTLDRVRMDTVRAAENVNIIFWNKQIMRPKVLANTNKVVPGTVYSEKVIKSTYERFTNLRFFNSVNVQLDRTDSAMVDCTIRLSPSKVQGYKLNFEMSANSTGLLGVSPAISYYNKNLFKGGEWFDLSLMGNFQFKFNDPIRSNEFGATASLSLPKFLFLPDRLFTDNLPRTEISFSYNFQSRPEYTRNILSASYGYTWNIRNRFFYRISPIQISIVKLFNLSDAFYESLNNPYLRNSYQDHFDLGLGTMFYYTTDASVNPRKSYFYLRWQNDIAGNLLSLFNNHLENKDGTKLIWGAPYSQYYRSEVSAVYTWKFGKANKHALAGRILAGAGIAYGNSRVLPFEKLFWAGGANSLRGWQAKTVGPGMSQIDDRFSIPDQTGDMKLEANLEYRFPIAWKFAGGVFIDAGNIWNFKRMDDSEDAALGVIKAETFLKSIAVSYGLGIRLDMDFVLMRLDFGFVGHDPRRQCWVSPKQWFGRDNYCVQFGVGYPF